MICALLIQQSECPKGNLVQVAIFDVVFDHIGKYNKTALKKQQFSSKRGDVWPNLLIYITLRMRKNC
jgi:hypothetical protein